MLFRDLKRLLATLIAGVIGVIVLVDFAATLPGIDAFARLLIDWAALLVALALVVGLLSVVITHLVRIVRRQADWGYSVVLLLSMIVVIVSGTVIGFTANGYILFPQLIDPPVLDLFNAIYQPLAASFLALLAFFSLSAALRAVRRRTADALVITVVGLVALLAAGLPQVEGLPYFGDSVRWVNNYLVLAGARGLLLGSAIGALVAGVRVLLGFDQPYLDR